MARFPSIDNTGAFEAPEVRDQIKELVTGTTDGITVDTSVGTRVYVGDTMIHGDTGWRDLTPYLEPGVTPSTNLGEARFKRENNRVYVEMKVDLSEEFTGSTLAILPEGFRASSFRYLAIPFTATGAGQNASNHVPFSGMGYTSLNGRVQTPSNVTFQKSSTVIWFFDFESDPSWPATLPSTPK